MSSTIAGPDLVNGVKMIAPLGMIVSYAVLGGIPQSDLFAAMRSNIEASPAFRCFTMHTYDHMPAPRREAFAAAVDLLASGVQPAIAARFPLRDVRQAHDLIGARGAMGKIVLTP
jgi:NADPH:quinone reductase